MKRKKDYTISKYPKSRRIASDLFSVAIDHHTVHGLCEIDVTRIREYIANEEERNNKISFTGYILYCLVKAISENKMFNSFRKGGRKIITFDDVDISVIVEVEENWKLVPVLYLINSADKKSFEEINKEIQNLKVAKKKHSKKQSNKFKVYFLIPRFFRKMLIRRRYRNNIFYCRYNPFFRKKSGGTACVSSVGMYTGGGGWGVPISAFTVFLLIGGLDRKPIVENNQIVIREIVNLTFSFDHDIIDGAIGSRLIKRIRELIKDGYGLPSQ